MKSRTSSPGVGHPWRLLLILVALITLWRLVIAAVMPVTQDEAYYFDWARSLAWGYFDHPPGVALLGLGVRLEPGSALAARLGIVLAGALALLVLARFYRRCGLQDPLDAGLALLLAVATLPGLAAGVIATPDAALALAWALALHEAERALAGDRRRWVTAGVATGLGLLGKYTMVLIGPVFLWAILWVDRPALGTRWPYLGGLAALLIFMPNILWNADNDWLSMGFQLGHGFSTEVGGAIAPEADSIAHDGPRSAGERLVSLAGYLGTQLGLWGVLLLPLAARRWMRPPEHRIGRKSDAPVLSRHGRALLIAASVLPLGFFAGVSLTSEVEANWPVVYLMGAAPLVALWLRRAAVWAAAAAGVNLLLLSLYAVHAATDVLPLPDGLNRVLRETHGFADLAAVVGELDAPVFADRYQTTAMLRFYRPDLETTQWPGLTRSSEYLRGHIAPRLEPGSVAGPFWLVARAGAAPRLPGARAELARTFIDCPRHPLTEGQPAPCDRPLHVWHLYRYVPE